MYCKYVCSGYLCCVCGLVEFLVAFMVFNLWFGPGFIFESYS
jgi:hypothetical protein